MANITKQKHIKKSKIVPKEKARILERFCSAEQIKIIQKILRTGATIIVLGSEFSYTGEFYKGLMQLMYQPTFNGACCYDAHYKYRNGYDRPVITISINDGVNKNKVESIKQLDRYRTKTLYTFHYE